MVIRRIGRLSCAKIVAALYAVFGLVIGGIVSLFSLAADSRPPRSHWTHLDERGSHPSWASARSSPSRFSTPHLGL